MKNKKTSLNLLAGLFGHSFEFYEFAIFSILTPTLVELFFPYNHDRQITANLIVLLYVSGIGARFLGGIIFGHLGDKIGRKPLLTITFIISGIVASSITILPTFEEIGILATIGIFVLRILQGACMGVEAPNATVFILEHKFGAQKGLISGIIGGFGVLGMILAIITNITVYKYKHIIGPIYWKIPFILGIIILCLGYYIRHKSTETPEYQQLLLRNTNTNDKIRIRELISSIIICTMAITISATITGYLNIFFQSYQKFPLIDSLIFTLFGACIFAIFLPIFGKLNDKFNSNTCFKIATMLAILVIPFSFSCIMGQNKLTIISGIMLLSLCGASICSNMYPMLYNIFSVENRCSGFSLSINIASLILAISFSLLKNCDLINIPNIGSIHPNALFLSILALISCIMAVYIEKKNNREQYGKY